MGFGILFCFILYLQSFWIGVSCYTKVKPQSVPVLDLSMPTYYFISRLSSVLETLPSFCSAPGWSSWKSPIIAIPSTLPVRSPLIRCIVLAKVWVYIISDELSMNLPTHGSIGLHSILDSCVLSLLIKLFHSFQ